MYVMYVVWFKFIIFLLHNPSLNLNKVAMLYDLNPNNEPENYFV